MGVAARHHLIGAVVGLGSVKMVKEDGVHPMRSRRRRAPPQARWAITLVGGLGILLLGLALWHRASIAPDPARRFAATATDVPYTLTPLVTEGSFDRPVGISLLPDSPDVAVVPTQGGRIWRVPLSENVPPSVLGDIADRLIAEPDFEEGLVGLAFSPNYLDDRRLYLAYAAGEPRRSVLARFQVEDDQLNLQSEAIILELDQPTSTHNIGQIAFGPDGYLYVGFGDGGSEGDELGLAQDLGNFHGAIVRLDVSGDRYEIPADNPFVDHADARSEIFAYGFRNPWRFSFDPHTGDLWAGDVGEVTWEEVNQIQPGANYGWNLMEGIACFQTSGCTTSGLTPPRVIYGREHGCAITGGMVYRGQAMPELEGTYLYGDFCTGTLWAVSTVEDRPPIRLAQTGVPIVAFGTMADGEPLVVGFTGGLYQLQQAMQ